MTVDKDLSFSINSKITKANQIAGLIRRNLDYFDQQTFTQLFKLMVRPHLEYANAIWTPYKLEDIRNIESVQRWATKLVPGPRDLPYEERLKQLKLPTLAYRRLREI